MAAICGGHVPELAIMMGAADRRGPARPPHRPTGPPAHQAHRPTGPPAQQAHQPTATGRPLIFIATAGVGADSPGGRGGARYLSLRRRRSRV